MINAMRNNISGVDISNAIKTSNKMIKIPTMICWVSCGAYSLGQKSP